MTEDQQLLDSGTGEYPPVVEPAAQLGYGTFYDHASGYYYEYPVMLVGPPMPEQIESNCLAAMPCGPVPLRPIEWVNPAFVPKLSSQQYCYTDYQSTHNVDCATMVDAQGTMLTAENSTLNGNESCPGSASCSGSVAGEDALEQSEELPIEELSATEVQDGFNGPYMEPAIVQPMHIPHVVQPMAQPYMYPGHYMFGPSLVNVNGVTIQSGSMVRYSDVMATTTSVTCAKWRRKKRKRKQKRPPALENTEDEEEEYSSECENGTTQPPWSANSSTTTTTRPLNPECQEFQLRSIAELESTKSGPTTPENLVVETNSPLIVPSISPTPENSILSLTQDSLVSEDKATLDTTTIMLNDCPTNGDESKRLTESRSGFQKEPSANETDGGTAEPRGASDTQENNLHSTKSEDSTNLHTATNCHISTNSHSSPNLHNSSNGDLKPKELERFSKETLTLKPRINGIKEPEDDLSKLTKSLSLLEISFSSPHGDEKTCSRPASPEINRTTTPINAETQRLPESYESLVTRPVAPPRRKYNSKNAKFVREPTPGPDLTSGETNPEVENLAKAEKEEEEERQNGSLDSNENESKTCERLAEVSNDSGFESQTQTKLDDQIELEDRGKLDDKMKLEDRVKLQGRPITEAVTEWLRKANSPDLFLTLNLESETESEEDDGNLESKPPKNLQGNPIPALSSNGSANNESLLRLTSCGEFARTNKKVEELKSVEESTSAGSRRKRNSKNKKKKNLKIDGKILKQKTKHADCNGNIRISNSDKISSTFVGDCEFTEEDRVAGVRVASNSRINDEVKILRVQGPEEKDEDPATVRTFEKGEIVVSIDGKLLPMTKSNYEPVLRAGNIFEEEQTERVEKDRKQSKNQENGETEVDEIENEASLGSIEEPDVLECWEAETLEPVVSPKRLLRSKGSFHEGEAAEEDDLEEAVHEEVEHVKKYYRLARESVMSGTSLEEEQSEEKLKMNSGTVPNSPESLQSEEIPVFVSAERQRIPIDEAFEVYESCYNGSQYITLDPRFRKQRSLYGHEDGPIPCKPVCCNIQ